MDDVKAASRAQTGHKKVAPNKEKEHGGRKPAGAVPHNVATIYDEKRQDVASI
ncbi:MAG: hypothetical protein SPJ13_06605 [Bacteroidales bacterium]|nr:hypothetical protein [Bacteroidales bacterium]